MRSVSTNYHSGRPYWSLNETFEQHLQTWLSTPQTDTFLSTLAKSLEDPSTIAELWEDNGAAVGFLWVVFHTLEGYETMVAEVDDLEVHPNFQRRGIGSEMLSYAEQVARERGVHVLRSGTGSENRPSINLHEKSGFRPSWLQYDKVLGD